MKQEGKLSRFWARICLILCAVCGVLLLFGAWTEQKWLIALGCAAAILCIVLRFTLLKCPHCGYRAATPQWSKSGTLHCIRCGEPFEYDR